MDNWVKGLHHITGAVSSGQADYDFYTKTLGLRLVKRTINHETADSWHFFYGDYDGNAGTIMTNFFMEGVPLPPYRRGRGTITEVTYSVPESSLGFWQERLAAQGLVVERRGERFGEEVLFFEDPAGLPSELIACVGCEGPACAWGPRRLEQAAWLSRRHAPVTYSGADPRLLREAPAFRGVGPGGQSHEARH